MNGVAMFGGFKVMIERNKRNTLEQFTTCSRPFERNERNTPLWGVTVVRGVRLFEMFFIPLFDAEAMNANLPKDGRP